jgi:hypothetical protein
MARSNRAYDAKARAREARAVMLAKRQAQDERIEDATASALLAIEDRDAAQAEVEQQERTLAAALQKLNQESVTVRDTMTMTGLSEKYVTRLLRLQLDATTDRDDNSPTTAGTTTAAATATTTSWRCWARPRPAWWGWGLIVLLAEVRCGSSSTHYGTRSSSRGTGAKLLEVPGSDCLWSRALRQLVGPGASSLR